MSKNHNFCQSCGGAIDKSAAFCPSCGSSINDAVVTSAAPKTKNPGILSRYWKMSVKGKIFYGAWVFLNISNGLNLISASSAPKDRFRSVCNWEGVNCPPSAQEQAVQSFFNLVFWNLFFWGFRYFYRKRQLKKSIG